MTIEMDDRLAQFVIALGDLLCAAELGTLPVQLRTRYGTSLCGVPRGVRHAGGREQFDETGYARTFRIGDALVNLDQVAECTVAMPGPSVP